MPKIGYIGFDLLDGCEKQPSSWKRETPEECFLLCQQTDGCELFTWMSAASVWPEGRKRCCLKYQATPNPISQGAVVSGIKNCGNCNTININYNPS